MKVTGLRKLAAPMLSLSLSLSLSLGLAALVGVPALAAADRNVDARQGTMQARLRDAMEAGRLTDAKLHEMKQELQKVADQEAIFKSKDGELSTLETMQLHTMLDKLNKELESALTERTGASVDVEAVRNQLSQRMMDALESKRLTQEKFDRFHADLMSIDKQIAAAKNAGGQIATNDQMRIELELDNLSQRFLSGEREGLADLSLIDKRKEELRTMIRQGVARGHLTEDEVDDLRQQLYNYDAKEERMTKMGRPLTSDEQLAMALELERFGAEIRARMDNGVDIKITARTIDHRKAALDQTFANALFGGDLTVAEAKEFKDNLDQITVTENALKSQNNGQLSQEQIEDILITVEKLKGKFSRLTFNRNKAWTGVDGLVISIRDQIAQATQARLLSAQENDDLQSKIADILVAKSNERNAQGLATTDAALKLAAELTALSDQLTHEIAAKSTKPKA